MMDDENNQTQLRKFFGTVNNVFLRQAEMEVDLSLCQYKKIESNEGVQTLIQKFATSTNGIGKRNFETERQEIQGKIDETANNLYNAVMKEVAALEQKTSESSNINVEFMRSVGNDIGILNGTLNKLMEDFTYCTSTLNAFKHCIEFKIKELETKILSTAQIYNINSLNKRENVTMVNQSKADRKEDKAEKHSKKTQETKNMNGEASLEDDKDGEGLKTHKAFVITQKNCKLVVKRLKKEETTDVILKEYGAIFKKLKSEKGLCYETVFTADDFSMDEFMLKNVRSMKKNYSPEKRKPIKERAYVMKWNETQIQFHERYNTESLSRYRGNLYVKSGKEFHFLCNRRKRYDQDGFDDRRRYGDRKRHDDRREFDNKREYDGRRRFDNFRRDDYRGGLPRDDYDRRPKGNWNRRNYGGQAGYNYRLRINDRFQGDRYRNDRNFRDYENDRNYGRRWYGNGQWRNDYNNRRREDEYRPPRRQYNNGDRGVENKIVSSLGKILENANRVNSQPFVGAGYQAMPQVASTVGPRLYSMPMAQGPFQNFY